jgi:PmbA protein
MANALANSHGFCSGYESSFVSVQVEVIADDDGGKKRNGSWYSFARHREDLRSATEVGRVAAERALRQLGARPIATGKMPVVFDPWMASSLVGTLFGVLRGGAIERRSSYLVDRVGESIGSELLTLIDDPLIPRAPGSKPYDGEGLAARRTVFVDGGVLQGYALNSYSARKLGLQPTGHASRPASGSTGESSSNLFLQAGDRTPESIIGDVEYGFYCESMMGFGFNPATGDFSRGASGRLIENGVLTRAVSEITVSGNCDDIFAGLDAVGNDLVFDRSTTSPTLRIKEMTVAGS